MICFTSYLVRWPVHAFILTSFFQTDSFRLALTPISGACVGPLQWFLLYSPRFFFDHRASAAFRATSLPAKRSPLLKFPVPLSHFDALDGLDSVTKLVENTDANDARHS